MADTVAELGRIDSVFVNAGVSSRASSFVDMSSDEWRRVMSVNLDGAYYTAREAVRHMVERTANGDQAGGSIVFTTSGSAFFGQQNGQNYGASKAAINSMMKGIAVQYARHGIRCNSGAARLDESEMTAPAFGWDKFVSNVMPRVPLRRWGTPEEFAGIAVYLASKASSYHTGDVVTLDGGYHSSDTSSVRL